MLMAAASNDDSHDRHSLIMDFIEGFAALWDPFGIDNHNK